MKAEVDLRELNLKEGDLILLIDDDVEANRDPLLAFFKCFRERFEDREVGNIVVEIKGEPKNYLIETQAAVFLYHENLRRSRIKISTHENLRGSKIKIPTAHRLPLNEKNFYCPDRAYVGGQKVIEALKQEAYDEYVSVLEPQLVNIEMKAKS